MMFAVESGAKKLQQWVAERRNVYDDYRMAFGEEPAMISGAAIMAHTDNTRKSAVAWHGDIVFSCTLGAPDQGGGSSVVLRLYYSTMAGIRATDA